MNTFSCRASLISWMPVLLMNSGSSNGGFSMPLLPCRYFLLKHQWRGTGTVFLAAFRWTSSLGSCAVTSCISTTSGRATSWQTEEHKVQLHLTSVLKIAIASTLKCYLNAKYNYEEDGFIVTHIKGLNNPTFADNVLCLFLRQIWRNASVSQQPVLCSEWVPSEWESDKHITVIHTTPVHQLMSWEAKR